MRTIGAIPAGAAMPLALLHRACFPEDPWDAEALERILALSGSFGYVAWKKENPVGFLLARDLGDEVEILSLGVLPCWRRRGIGGQLLAATAAAASHRNIAALMLEVATDNEAAYRLYKGFGFRQAGRRPRYYNRIGGAADALIMRCEITAKPEKQ